MQMTTDRLLLRRWRDTDVDPYAQACADPQVMRYIGDGTTLTHEEAAAQIERFERHWDEHGFGLWAVETLASGAFVGFAGLSVPYFLPEVLPAVEVGWRFAQHQWGLGYATESGLAALAFGFDQVGLDRIIGIVDAGNVGSQRAMFKLGMTLERETVHPQLGLALRVYEKVASAPAA